ncbi:MAG: GNAT family N-acetyltransferase [Actinomycetota bacterium]|nr:GNAT family N-acetyltransferase [Actinomycetota bacterium]
MSTVLRTARVLLREFTSADLEVLAAMMADQDQMRLYPRPRTKEETTAWLDRTVALYRKHGFGFWLMESVEGAEFLGYCGIRPRWVDAVEEVEMGWHTVKHFWNQGIATHAAAACRDLAFTRLDIPRLVALIDPDNPASIRVAAKIGMQLEKEAVVDDWPCLVYSAERHLPGEGLRR